MNMVAGGAERAYGQEYYEGKSDQEDSQAKGVDRLRQLILMCQNDAII